ncbi:MAG TPA: phosphotransferase [Streptosporangiaceae bacterium]|nr:phosphotransferase [Streptosporangiaceae bacterium]
MSRALSTQAACDLAARMLGQAVDDAVEVPAFAGSQVFRIAGHGLVAFLKLADADDLRREVAVIELLGPRGVPVPVVEAADPAGATHGIPCVLGDFHPRHVYADCGRVTAFIGWGDATVGDPRCDLARIFHSAVMEHGFGYGLAVMDRFLDGYGDAPWLRTDPTQVLMVYTVVFILWSMHGEFAAGTPWPPWWPAQRAALQLILDELAY